MLHPYIIVALALALIILLSFKLKLHPFLSLFVGALFTGILSGQAIESVIAQLISGFGTTLGQIGWIIAFGTLLGVLLEKTKATQIIVGYLLRWIGIRRAGLALNLTGFLVAIPVFCDAAFILLSGINKGLQKRTGLPLSFFATALATGLYAAHVFVPPTPGPLAAAALLDANLGYVLIGGLAMAFPVALVGYFWAKFTHKKQLLQLQSFQASPKAPSARATKVFLPILVPVLLSAFKAVGNYPELTLKQTWGFALLQFLGHPIIALCVGISIAYFSNYTLLQNEKQLPQWISDGLAQAGVIILVTGAGGAFGAVLKGLQIADTLAATSATPLLALTLIFGMAAVLKTAQGSSTVAIVTTAALVAPILATLGLANPLGKVCSVLAIGGGALTVSHINDSYFWVVSQFSEMTPKQALKYYTTATALQGIIALGLLLLGYFLLF